MGRTVVQSGLALLLGTMILVQFAMIAINYIKLAEKLESPGKGFPVVMSDRHASSLTKMSSVAQQQLSLTSLRRLTTEASDPYPSFHQRRTLVGMGRWVQVGNDIDGEAAFDRSGLGLSMSSDGRRVAIGAPGNDGKHDRAGHVRVYELDETSMWKQMGEDLDPVLGRFGDQGGNLGGIIDLSGNGLYLAIGNPYYSSDPERVAGPEDDYIALEYDDDATELDGYVSVHYWNGSFWETIAVFEGSRWYERKGRSVCLSDNGDVLAFLNNDRVEVHYRFSRNNWTLLGRKSLLISPDSLTLSGNGQRFAVTDSSSSSVKVYRTAAEVYDDDEYLDEFQFDRVGPGIAFGDADYIFGVSMSYDGNRLAFAHERSYVRVYDLIGSSWIQTGGDIGLEISTRIRGVSMSSDGRRLILLIAEGSGTGNLEVARIYEELKDSSWAQVGNDIKAEAGSDDSDDTTSAISENGEFVSIGAYRNDGINGEDSGHVRVFKLESTPTSPFPDNFSQVICKYTTCLGNLLEKYGTRTEFGNWQAAYNTSRKRAKRAEKVIRRDGKVLTSLGSLRAAMKWIENLKTTAPGFSNNIGRSASTCAIKLVQNVILAYEGKGFALDDELLNQVRNKQLAGARAKRDAKKWQDSVKMSRSAIWRMMNELGEETVPLCK